MSKTAKTEYPQHLTIKKILDATYDLIIEGKSDELSFKLISSRSKLTEKQIVAEFGSIDEIGLEVSKLSIAKHKAQSLKIAKLKGVDALTTMVKHHLKMIYGLQLDRDIVEPKNKYISSLELFDNYIREEMPTHYEEIFKNNLELLPERGIDIRLYSHFIVHSLFFFNYEQLNNLTKEPIDRKLITQQIINSLFGNTSVVIDTDLIK